jgi:hypothetical protein
MKYYTTGEFREFVAEGAGKVKGWVVDKIRERLGC